MRAFLVVILLKHNNAARALNSVSPQTGRHTRSYSAPPRTVYREKAQKRGEAETTPASPLTGFASAHSRHHGFLHDAATLAVHLHEEHDADDRDDKTGDTNDCSPHERHDDGLRHDLRRGIKGND